MVTRFRKDGVLYSFYIWENSAHDGYKNFITLVCTGSDYENIYNIPVQDCSGYRVRYFKKTCHAAGGARGLFCFLSDCIKSDFMMDWVYKFIRQYDVKGGGMMRYECKFNLSALAVALLRNMDNTEIEKQYDEAHEKQNSLFSGLFRWLADGRLDCVWWRSGRGNLYALTRSAKDPDAIQNTCFWVRGSELVALSDRQYKCFDDMRRDYLPDNTVIHTF